MTNDVQAIPEGMHSLTPYLIIKDAPAAIAFYQEAFGAQELTRLQWPDGRMMHASIKIGDSVLMMSEEMPEFGGVGPKGLGGSPVTIHLYVEDVDAAWKKAIDAGCTATMPQDDTFWGDRFGGMTDPFGHNWSLAQHVRDVSPEEMMKAASDMDMSTMCGS